MQQESFLRKRGPVLFLAAFSVLLFWQYFLLDQTFYAGDMAFALLPLCRYAMERLISGELPLWNPHLIAGTPGLAEATHQTLYPPNLLLLLIGVPRGMGWLMPLHLFWMALGFYLFVRCAFGLGRIAATFSALSFAFGGLMLGGLSIPVYIYASSWIPWVFLSYEKARLGGWPAWAGVCVSMQLLTGGSTYAYYTMAMLLAYHLFCVLTSRPVLVAESPVASGSNAKGWWVLGLTGFIAVGLSAAQLIPQTELALASERGTRATYEYVIYGSLVPHHFPVTALFPGFYGLFDSPTREGFIPTAQLGYMGVPALICIFIAALISHRRRQVWFWLGIGTLALTLAFGQFNPFYHFFYEWVPGFASFRWPTRWLIVTVFAGAALAGMGVEALQRVPFEARCKQWSAIAVAAAIGVAGILFLLLSNAPAEAAATAWPQLALVALTLILLVLLPRKSAVALENEVSRLEAGTLLQARTRWVLLTLTGLLAVDLWLMSQGMELQHTLSVAALEEKPSTAKFLTTQPQQERFWALAPPMPLESWQAGMHNVSPLEFRARSAAALREMMPSCIASDSGGLGLTGAWGSLMPTRRNARPLYVGETKEAVKQRWLRLLNARYYIDLQPVSKENLQVVNNEPPYIYRDEQALPRAFWVPQAQRLDAEKIVDVVSQGKLDDQSFDPRRMVLLEDAADESDTPPELSRETMTAPTVELKDLQPEEVQLKVDSPGEGYVVLMDTAYPGWRALVDGKPVEWEPANWVGRALRVPEGSHEVRYYYEPQSVRLGLFLSITMLSVLAFSWTFRSKKK